MSSPSLRQRLARLKEISKDGGAGHQLLSEIKQLLLIAFEETFEIIRTQKILTQSRQLEVIASLTRDLQTWLKTANLDKRVKPRLKRHLELCMAAQEVFNEIDSRSRSLSIWKSDRDSIVKSVLGYVEITDTVARRHSTSLKSESLHDPQTRLRLDSMLHDSMREVCDAANLILSRISKGIEHGSRELGADEVREAFEIAREAVNAQFLFDRCAFEPWTGVVKSKRISIRPQSREAYILNYLTQQRIQAIDDVTGLHAAMKAGQIRSGIQLASLAIETNRSFEEFLNDPKAASIVEASRAYAEEVLKSMRQEVIEVFETTATLTTVSGTFTIAKLLECWAFFVMLHFCGTFWLESQISEGTPANYTGFAATIGEARLVRMLGDELSIGESECRSLLAQFTTSRETGQNVDLFYRPLVRLEHSEILVSFAFIGMSRFYRNVFMIALRESELDLSPRGFKPLHALRRNFERLGFRAVTNLEVRIGKSPLTDIDLVLAKDGILFLCQVKVVIQPDGPYEYWKVGNKLEQAASQMRAVLDHFGEVEEEVFVAMKLTGKHRVTVDPVPFLLTNAHGFTGSRMRKLPVVDFDYLRFIARGARLNLLEVYKGEVQPLRSHGLVAGETVTGREFKRLIENPMPYYRSFLKSPKLRTLRKRIGSYLIETDAFEFKY